MPSLRRLVLALGADQERQAAVAREAVLRLPTTSTSSRECEPAQGLLQTQGRDS